jgi:GxxExxY protein
MMHPLFEKADAWTGQVIAAAIEVHRRMGPGLLEEIYERCLMREMEIRHIPAENQVRVPIEYKGMIFEQPLRLDLYVDSCLIVEIKAVEHVLPIHKAQLISYMKLLNVPLGLLMNFHENKLKDGVSRLILPGSGEN